MTSVSLVLPVANQADHIERVVEAHLRALLPLDCSVEMVLVVNNSQDDSLAACERLRLAHPAEVGIVTSPPGWGNAVLTGLAATRGEVVGFCNSARTHTSDIVRAVEHALANPQALVKGRRVNRAYSLPRRAGSKIFNMECLALYGLRSPDINGNPKLWRRELLPPELLAEPGSFLDAEILIHARKRNIPLVEFDITDMRRHGGTSMTTLGLALTLYARPISRKLGRKPCCSPVDEEVASADSS